MNNRNLTDSLEERFEELGVNIPNILLPDDSVAPLEKWAVIACDQYTAEPEYWEEVNEIVGGSPSALRLILPEAYLEQADLDTRIDQINRTMKQYLQSAILKDIGAGFVYVKRYVPGFKVRKGLVMALDLEKYDYGKGSKSIIRPTEDTVVDRLPPRIKIRSKACIELPHILVLIDDHEKQLIEPLENETGKMNKLYEFELMKGGGGISGHLVNDREILQRIAAGLERLAHPARFSNKYNTDQKESILLYAIGDGNHSLAAAKAHWENLKASNPGIDKRHPARYALVELLNIHDEGIVFEPIHRVVFNVEPLQLLDALANVFGDGLGARYRLFGHQKQLDDHVMKNPPAAGCHFFKFVCRQGHGCIYIDNPNSRLPAGTLQSFLDDYASKNPMVKIDYIHGDEAVFKLASRENAMGFYLPPMDKGDFFKTVIKDGVLPRKTFSMGESYGKRYYIEARKISNF